MLHVHAHVGIKNAFSYELHAFFVYTCIYMYKVHVHVHIIYVATCICTYLHI